MISIRNSWYAICLFVLVLFLAVGCAPGQAAEGVDPTAAATIATAEPTTTPQPTGTPIPTAAPAPTDTPQPTTTAVPSPTAVPAPDLSREFDIATCSGDKAIAAFYEDMPVGELATIVKDDFYGPDVAYGLWSHLTQQADGAAVGADGCPLPYYVLAKLDDSDEIIYDICLKRLGARDAPVGVSLLAAMQIPAHYIESHCEDQYGVPDFIPFVGPETIEVAEQTTISQFLEEHSPSPCYGAHKDFAFTGDRDWYDIYQNGSQRQLIVAHFWDQGAEPLPPPFEENGVMRKAKNNFPYNAIIPPGEYAFYEEREMLSLAGYATACSESPPAFIVPVSSPNCYHGFQQGPDGFYHQANDFKIAIGEQGYAPSAGTVIYTDSYFGGRVIIDHGGCWYSQLGHSTPLVGVGDQVAQGQAVTVAQQYNEVEWAIGKFTTPPIGGFPDTNRYDGSALIGYSCAVCPDC